MAKNTCLGVTFNSQADKQGELTKYVSEILGIPNGMLVDGSVIKQAIEEYASVLGTQNNISIDPSKLLEQDKTTKEYKLKEIYREGFREYLQDKYTNKNVIIANAKDIRDTFEKDNIERYSIEDNRENANKLSKLITERFGNIVTVLPLAESKFLVYVNNVVTAEEYTSLEKEKTLEKELLSDYNRQENIETFYATKANVVVGSDGHIYGYNINGNTDNNFILQEARDLKLTSDQVETIYQNYIKLMDRKREGKGISIEKFNMMRRNLQVFINGDTYIFGEWDSKNNLFRGRLMSSPNIRTLYSSLDVLINNIPFAASVPEDIGRMLRKKGMYELQVDKPYNFRGEEMIKHMYFSNEDLAKKVFGNDLSKVSTEAVQKYDTFYNYWEIVRRLRDAYLAKDYDSIYGILTELGIYDKNAYDYAKRFKSGNLTEKQGSDIIETILNNSRVNSVKIDGRDFINSLETYNKLNTNLNKLLATYLSKFGFKTEVVNSMNEHLGLDGQSTVLMLNKIFYVNEHNQTDYPQLAGKAIAYMMQFNPIVSEIVSDMRKMSIFKNLKSKEDYLDAVGDLIADELHKRTNTEIPETLIDKIRTLIKQFFNFLNNIQIKRINRNVGYIVDNIMLNNEALITQSTFKPGAVGKEITKVSLEDALKSDSFGNEIVEKMADTFILVGSVAISEQGTIYRPKGNQLHDLDWASPLPYQTNKKIFEDKFPEAKYIRNIVEDDSRTDTWLVVPEGYFIEDLILEGNKNKIVSYRIVDNEGNTVNVYDGIKDTFVNQDAPIGKTIDIFSDAKNEVFMSKTLKGHDLMLGGWKDTFEAKMKYGRIKDIWDYNRFIPNENINNLNNEMQQIKDQAIADGTFMKAPNGKPTNLNERQWLLVRTKAFKDWFGDWERVAPQREFENSLFRGQAGFPTIDENGNLVLKATYDNLWKGRGLSFATNQEEAENYGRRSSRNPIIIEIDKSYLDEIIPLDENAGTQGDMIRSIGDEYGANEREERLLFTKDIVIPKGKFKIHHEKSAFPSNTYELAEQYISDFDNYNIADEMPFGSTINKISYREIKEERAELLNRFDGDENKLEAFLTEVTNRFVHTTYEPVRNKEVSQYLKFEEAPDGSEIVTFTGTFKKEVSQSDNSVSKVVDENGEPLVVYHGGNKNINTFSIPEDMYYGTDGGGIYFTSDKNYAKFYESQTGRGELYPVFLNIKNPIINQEIDRNSVTQNKVSTIISNKNNDGIIGHDKKEENIPESKGWEYVAFTPNQVKSATDNVGTFSRENDDIYYEHSEKNRGLRAFRDKQLEEIFDNNFNSNNTQIDVLQAIKDRMSNSRYSKIFGYLEEKGLLKGLNISLENGLSTQGRNIREDKIYQGRRAYYDANTNTIHINALADFAKEGIADAIIMHEILHSVTVARIQNSKVFKDQIQDVIDKYNNESSKDSYKYTGDHAIEEFVADLWSNPTLAQQLQRISATKKFTLLDRIKEILNKIFTGLFKGNPTLFEQASSMVIELLDQNVSQQGEGLFYEQWARMSDNGYEVSSKGDSRFSALNAKFKHGTILFGHDVGGRTIESVYQHGIKQGDWITDNNSKTGAPKNKTIITGNTEDASYEQGYLPLWKEWAKQNPNLIEELRQKSQGKTLTDQFANTRVSQARALSDILNNPSWLLTPQKPTLQDYVNEVIRVRNEFAERIVKDDNFSENHIYWIVDEDGKKHQVTTTITTLAHGSQRSGKIEPMQKAKMAFGNIFDSFVRDYFATDGKMVRFKTYPIIGGNKTQMFTDLKKEVGKLKKHFDEKFGKGRYKVLTKFEPKKGNDEFTVGGQIEGHYTAGTMDMFVVTDEGKLYIYDMKATMSKDEEFNLRANQEYQGQLELYRKFFNANSKLQVVQDIESLGLIVANVKVKINGEESYLSDLYGYEVSESNDVIIRDQNGNILDVELQYNIRENDKGGYVRLFDELIQDNQILKNPGIKTAQVKRLFEIPQVKQIVEDIEKSDVPKAEKQKQLNELKNAAQTVVSKKEQQDTPKSVAPAFNPNKPVTQSQVLFMGRNMVKLISLYADTIAKNPSILEKMGYSTLMKSTLEIPEGLTGNQVLKRHFTQLRPFFIKYISNMYFKEREGDSKMAIAQKRWFKGFTKVDGLVRKNLDVVLDKAFGEFMEIEDIKIADATYQTLEDVDYDISNIEEGLLIYGFDSRERNYIESISTQIRRKLATIMQFQYKRNDDGTYTLDSDGMPIIDTITKDGKEFRVQEKDPYGFGMPVFKEKFDVINFLLNMFHSCATSESLMRNIKEEVKNTPWLSEVYKMLVNDKTLQTQMMQALHRNQTSYASVYSQEYTEPGESEGQYVKKTKYVIKNENSRARTEVLKSSVYRFYLSRQTSSYLKYNSESQKYRLDLPDTVNNMMQKLQQIKSFEQKKAALISLLSDLGINTSFINNYDKLLDKNGLDRLIQRNTGRKRTGALRYLLENMAPNREFDYDTIASYYTPLFMVLQEGMPNQYELSTRIGDKTYMTYSLVSYIEREIQRIAGNDIDVSRAQIFGENSIYRRYRQYNAGGKDLFVNSIIQELSDNEELRQYLQYYTLPAVDGKPLFKQNEKEYLMQILLGYFGINQEGQTSFFFEDSTMKENVALFRVGTMSDKPTSDYIQWRKEATLDFNSPIGDKGKQKMRDDITEKVSRYFWYELSRARSVVEQAKYSPDADVANIHLNRKKAASLVKKIQEEKNIERADLYENGKLKSYIEGSGMTFRYVPVLNMAFDYDAKANRDNDNIVDNPEFNSVLEEIAEDVKKRQNPRLNENQLQTLSQAFVTLYLRKLNNENLTDEETKTMELLFSRLYQHGMSLEFGDFLDMVDSCFQGNYDELQSSIKELTVGNREDYLEEFFYNDSLMAMNIYNILIGDPAYYKDAVDLQKRFAEVHSSSARPDVTATVDLNTFEDHDSQRNNNTEMKLTDGKCRVVILKDSVEQNEELALTIAKVFGKLEENARKEGRGKEADQFKVYRETIPTSLREGIEVTDGQAFSSPTGFWKKLHMLGDANVKELDRALKDIREGKIKSENIDVVIQEFKPFIYSRVHKNGNTSLGDELVSLQIKDSEAMIMLAGAIIQGAQEKQYIKDNPLVEMFNFMEASHYGRLKEYFEGTFNPESVSIDDYRPDGIDTMAFLSSVKNGSWAVVDLNGKTSEQMREELKNCVRYEVDNTGEQTGQMSWNDDFVHPMAFEDWGKQQENPAHMQDHEQDIGSQIKMLSVSDLPDNFKVKIKGVEYDKKSFLNRYFKLLEEDYREGIEQIFEDLNILDKYDKKENRVITKDEKLAKLVRKSILNDSKLNSELLDAFTLEEYEENGMKKKRFKYPVGDPSIAPKLFSVVFNAIKDEVNRQKLPGGPIVQVAPYGMSDKLHLVDDNGDIISRDTLFDKNGNITKSVVLEVYITPPTKLLQELLTKKDGSLMSVKEALDKGTLKDEDLELIGYRIPTEDKYSMYRMKIKGFIPRNMGEQIIMPREITWLSGSDYDIDKIFTMFRYHIFSDKVKDKNKKSKERMNEVFDMQWAALQHPSSVEKQLNHGDFSELGDLANLISGSKKIGSTMFVQNQMRFHRENAAGKEFVGIAALNNVSHVISNFAEIHFKDKFDFNFKILMRPKNDQQESILFNQNDFADSSQKVRIDPTYSPVDGSRLSRNIGEYVGASADNAKNALLGKLNTRPITATLAMGMLRMGFPVSTVSFMLSMPKVVELANKAQLEGKRIESLIYQEAQYLDESLVTSDESILSEQEMLDFTTGKNQDSNVQDAVLVFLNLISPYCKAIGDTNALLSLNSMKNAVGPNEYATKEREYKIRKVLDNNFENELFDDDISNLRKVTSFIQPLANCFTYIVNDNGEVEQGLVSKIMSDYSPLYQRPFEQILDTAAYLGISMTQQNIKSLYNAFLVWDSNRKQVIDFSPEYMDYLLYEYPVEFAKKIKEQKFATTKIPSLLVIGDMNNSTKIQSVNFLNSAPRDAKDDFTADLQDAINAEDQEFFLDLVRYNIMRFGFIWQPKSMYANSPNNVRNLLMNYNYMGDLVSLRTLFESPELLSKEDIGQFLALYMRNNPESSQLPYIPFSVLKEKGGYIKQDNGFIFENKRYKSLLIDPEISSDPEFSFTPETTLLIRVGKDLYQRLYIDGTDYRYVKVNRLGIQSNFMEYQYTDNNIPVESICNTFKGLLQKAKTKKVIEEQEELTSDDNENIAGQEEILPYEIRASLQEMEREALSKIQPIIDSLKNSSYTNFIGSLGRTTSTTKTKAYERLTKLTEILDSTVFLNNGEGSLDIKEVKKNIEETIQKYKLC